MLENDAPIPESIDALPETLTAAQNDSPLVASNLHRELRMWVRDLLLLICCAVVITVFLYQPVKVEGTSMAPLISDQERIFINKLVYKFEPISRGDVVVFWYPSDRTKSFIKRVVALPGETVEIRQGRVYVNQQSLDEPYILPAYLDANSYPAFRVPPHQYFVMGDHRDSSNDSRMFGPVPSEYIYGKAVFAYWPMDHFGTPSDSVYASK
jgi:signal peptidase I